MIRKLTPQDVAELRIKAGMTHASAAKRFSKKTGRAWQYYESSTENVRSLKPQEQELLLLLANEHPTLVVQPRTVINSKYLEPDSGEPTNEY
ncbi:hypothetical protein NFB50_16495 [Yersinia ruckeri]|uniref:hypothetical protein n=1 Tax=Yersinia ruckeri TaxID=29486 RepID=UPI0020BF5986|nr:hypothetical protein [Yersinia ruckeri]MCW6560059.1 hypothetical protein [Yersinia ruckeri]MCW6595964.1 hypothetical protein [Yersinia ruckeri]UZY16931.1 hypothetical protein LNQ37_017640 [Yersinia ruckeri]